MGKVRRLLRKEPVQADSIRCPAGLSTKTIRSGTLSGESVSLNLCVILVSWYQQCTPAFFRIRPRSLLPFSPRKVGDQQKLGHVGDPLH